MRPIRITPKILEVYRHARKVYDDTDTDRQTVALEACSGLCDKLYFLLGRTDPWAVEIFTTIEEDHPDDWENAESWCEAKQILTALERAAQD